MIVKGKSRHASPPSARIAKPAISAESCSNNANCRHLVQQPVPCRCDHEQVLSPSLDERRFREKRESALARRPTQSEAWVNKQHCTKLNAKPYTTRSCPECSARRRAASVATSTLPAMPCCSFYNLIHCSPSECGYFDQKTTVERSFRKNRSFLQRSHRFLSNFIPYGVPSTSSSLLTASSGVHTPIEARSRSGHLPLIQLHKYFCTPPKDLNHTVK